MRNCLWETKDCGKWVLWHLVHPFQLSECCHHYKVLVILMQQAPELRNAGKICEVSELFLFSIGGASGTGMRCSSISDRMIPFGSSPHILMAVLSRLLLGILLLS